MGPLVINSNDRNNDAITVELDGTTYVVRCITPRMLDSLTQASASEDPYVLCRQLGTFFEADPAEFYDKPMDVITDIIKYIMSEMDRAIKEKIEEENPTVSVQ